MKKKYSTAAQTKYDSKLLHFDWNNCTETINKQLKSTE